MRNSNHAVSRGIAKLAFAAMTVTLATTLAFAKTAEQCQQDYDKATNRCHANPDTSHMDTLTDVRYCLQRAKNKFNNCMNTATMSVPGELKGDPGSQPPKPPKWPGKLAPGLLDNAGTLTTVGPSPAGTPVAPAAPAAGRIL